MKTRLVALVLLVLVIAVPVTAFAATYLWKQGYAVGHGKGTTQAWIADLTGKVGTFSKVNRTVGDGLTGSSDSEAEAMVCKSYKLTQTGNYMITLSKALNGRIHADYRGGLGSGRGAWSNVSVVIRAWQGAWPGPAGHKFMRQVGFVKDTSIKDWAERDVYGTYTHSQLYPVSDISKPLKVCWGINSYSYLKGYGATSSDFHPGISTEAMNVGTVTVELVK
jgi:hypothetical protein